MVSYLPDDLGSHGWKCRATLRMQEEIGEKQALGKRHNMPVKVGGNLIDGIDEDLKTVAFNFDLELWQPASKNRREIPDESQGD